MLAKLAAYLMLVQVFIALDVFVIQKFMDYTGATYEPCCYMPAEYNYSLGGGRDD